MAMKTIEKREIVAEGGHSIARLTKTGKGTVNAVHVKLQYKTI